jgi:clan AA aspartic protease (TIGR02281 family)
MTGSFSFRRGRLIIPPVRIRHDGYDFAPILALDTGAQTSVVTPELARAVGIDLDRMENAKKLYGVAGSGWAKRIILEQIDVANIPVRNVEALVYVLPPNFQLDGIIGLNVLQHFNFTVHHETEKVRMEKYGGS